MTSTPESDPCNERELSLKIFPDSVAKALAESLAEALDDDSDTFTFNGKDFSGAVDQAIVRGGLSFKAVQTLQRVKAICQVADHDEALACAVLKDTDIPRDSQDEHIPSISDLALRYYNSTMNFAKIYNVKQEAIDTFKTELFRRAPLAALLGLLKAGKLIASRDKKLKSALQIDLEKVVKGNIPAVSTDLSEQRHPVAQTVPELVKILQRLQYLVQNPQDIGKLLAAKMESAHQIAMMNRDRFVEIMRMQSDPGGPMGSGVARQIHDRATAIECRNQETWATILIAINNNFELAPGMVKSQKTKRSVIAPSAGSGNAQGSRQHYNTTDIFDLQFPSCEECCSVTSASAYFADLLAFLGAHTAHARKVLYSRRPDLPELKLSCANSKDELPYIDIVNKVLVSFIRSKVVRDETDDTTIFKHHIAEQMFPLTIFPYNQALDTIKVYLSTIGVSHFDIVSTFVSEARILASLPPHLLAATNSHAALFFEAGEVSARALAAEILNLQPLDFAAIAHDGIYPQSFLNLMKGLSRNYAEVWGDIDGDDVGIYKTPNLWGYNDDTDMIAIDEKKELGLTFIKAQFLPRSGLSFEQLLELLNTLYVRKRLIITSANTKSNTFTGQVSEMRLRLLRITDRSNSPIGNITADICYELQSFIRLKNRLGWSISEVDIAIASLIENQQANGAYSRQTVHGITARILMDLSYVVRLSQLVHEPVRKILPLWANINHHGKKSLYETLFLSTTVSIVASAFKPTKDGIYLKTPDPGAIHAHITTICLAFGLSREDLELYVMEAAGLDTNCKLTLRNLSTLYRHSVMRRILDTPWKDYTAVLRVLIGNPSSNVFHDPMTTFTVVERWNKLQRARWSTADLLCTINDGGSVLDVHPHTSLGITASITEALTKLETTSKLLLQEELMATECVVDVCRQLWDKPTAEAVALLIEGETS